SYSNRQASVGAPGVKGCFTRVLGAGVDPQDDQCAGTPNHIWLQANKPGTYIGQCSEFCGTQHAWMHILVVADEPSKLEEWQRAQLQTGQSPTNDTIAKGLALFKTSTCINCHAIRGVAGADLRV